MRLEENTYADDTDVFDFTAIRSLIFVVFMVCTVRGVSVDALWITHMYMYMWLNKIKT